MKKGILILLAMFMMVSTVEAKKDHNFPNNNRFYYSYDNAVNFVERDVEFFIFPNGEFDFDVLSNNRFNLNIDRNFRGQIRRIGTVRISYDRFNNVTRIGNIFLSYNRGRLIRVGNLRVNYNRWNEPIFSGFVRDNYYFDNGIRFNLNLGVTYNFNDRFFYGNNFRTNYTQFREDRNFYYYKSNPNASIGKRSTILKRRKQVSVNNGARSTATRNSNQSYRKQTRGIAIKEGRNETTADKRATRNSVTPGKQPTIKSKREPINRENRIKKDARNIQPTKGNSNRKIERKSIHKNTEVKKRLPF
ncbi:hypothetical protein K8354_07555 [Polaribacter litorisediminis]|uniref:hypothetical protein n=1 Tax=Polaribacter litorisediminis TaxID=1908341 RepID=UPI001CC13053|nr:hypothetical protein [Polaribacter litorisediminis]UAM99651.1 hypothetical protein K8354_07555 [Polaribacter litorisediminis]